MNWLNKLPNTVRYPSGKEWYLFKKIPIIFLLGSLLILAPVTVNYLNNLINLGGQPFDLEQNRLLYVSLGLLFTYWFFVGAAAIGCIVVMLMKGPAYVADPYYLPKENKALEEFP
jgi:hypothetical protein